MKRIVSLLAAGTEILYALGLGDRVVAVSHECDHPPDVHHKPRVSRFNVDAALDGRAVDAQVRELLRAGRPLFEVDVAALAALAPDMIVTQSQCEVCAVDAESVAAAIRGEPVLRNTLLVSLNPKTLEGVLEDMERVGAAAGCESRAAELVASLRRRVEAVCRRTVRIPLPSRPRVACLEWIEPLMIAAHWMPDLIERAGGRNALTRPGERSRTRDWSEVVAFDPEVILIAPCGFDRPRAEREAAALQSVSQWHPLSAVKNGRTYVVDGNAYFHRSGPRIVDSLELLAALLHPEIFEPFLIQYAAAWSLHRSPAATTIETNQGTCTGSAQKGVGPFGFDT